MIIRIIDFETTGLPEDPDAEICEIGACDLAVSTSGEIEIDRPVARLCKPRAAIRPEIRAIHHITDRMLADAEDAPAVALDVLTARPADYFAAHHVTFEQHFFKAPAPWICTYRVALRLWPEAPGHGNQVLRYWLGLDLNPELAMPPHRAGPDAYVTAHLLAKEIEHGGASIEDMVRWSAGPPLLTNVTFGKHKGTKWKDLPTDYLIWIATKSDMDNDTKANARFRLKERGQ